MIETNRFLVEGDYQKLDETDERGGYYYQERNYNGFMIVFDKKENRSYGGRVSSTRIDPESALLTIDIEPNALYGDKRIIAKNNRRKNRKIKTLVELFDQGSGEVVIPELSEPFILGTFTKGKLA